MTQSAEPPGLSPAPPPPSTQLLHPWSRTPQLSQQGPPRATRKASLLWPTGWSKAGISFKRYVSLTMTTNVNPLHKQCLFEHEYTHAHTHTHSNTLSFNVEALETPHAVQPAGARAPQSLPGGRQVLDHPPPLCSPAGRPSSCSLPSSFPDSFWLVMSMGGDSLPSIFCSEKLVVILS